MQDWLITSMGSKIRFKLEHLSSFKRRTVLSKLGQMRSLAKLKSGNPKSVISGLWVFNLYGPLGTLSWEVLQNNGHGWNSKSWRTNVTEGKVMLFLPSHPTDVFYLVGTFQTIHWDPSLLVSKNVIVVHVGCRKGLTLKFSL